MKLVVHKAALVKAAVLELVEMIREKQAVVLSYFPSTGGSWSGHACTKTRKGKSKRDSVKPAVQEQRPSAAQPSTEISQVVLACVLGRFSKLVQDALCELVLRAYSLLHRAICGEVSPELSDREEESQLRLKVWLKFVVPSMKLVPSVEEVEEMVVELSSSIAAVLHQVPPWGDREGEEEREETVDQLFTMQSEIKRHFKG